MIEIVKKLYKYNFWEGRAIDCGFIRSSYLNKIQKYIGNDLIKVLVGQRRTGKSYILRQIIQELINQGINAKNIFYLNKELVDFDDIKTYRDLSKLVELYKKELKVRGKIFIFLDEVQEIDGWEKVVNSFSQDYKNKYELFITGSNSKLLSGELASYLSGRYISFEIMPFSFGEYCHYFSLSLSKESYLSYIKIGGLPELYKLHDEETRTNYVTSLQNTILFKDIVQRYNIKDTYLLETVFKFLIDNIGKLFSINTVVGYFNSHKIKTNFETISNYIEYLSQTFLIHGVERFDIKGKNILSRGKKYYVNDLSFKNYLSSSFDYGAGNILENCIYLYYRSLGYTLYVGTIGSKEIDFIIEKGKEKKYIQVAYALSDEKVIKREFGNLEEINDNYEKIVVSLDDFSLGNKEGISHIRVWELF